MQNAKNLPMAMWFALVAIFVTAISVAVPSVALAQAADIQTAATNAATSGITAGVAVAVIVLGGVLVYKLVKRFTS